MGEILFCVAWGFILAFASGYLFCRDEFSASKTSRGLCVVIMVFTILDFFLVMSLYSENQKILNDYKEYGTRSDTTITIKNGVCDTVITHSVNK